jgi:hypothetical protein
VRKIDSFLPLVRLKHEQEFTWGAEQRNTFEKIKEYLMNPPVLRAPRIGETFRLYIAAQHQVVGVMLTQEDKKREYPVAYLSRRLIDVETRFVPIEKLCLSLYFACSKLHHYLLSSTCVVVCRHDIVKFMLQKSILMGCLGKWVYALVEYNLVYEHLRSTRGQVVADFIVDHMAMDNNEACLVELRPWSLFFDGSVCSKGCGVGCILMSPSVGSFEFAVRLEFTCTTNQAEYEALLYGLEYLSGMGVKDVDAYGDSMLVVNQVKGESQCLDGILNN